MTRSKTLPMLLTAVVVAASAMAAATAPASAVSIKHTSRVGGDDPEGAAPPSRHSVPPVDTTAAHAFDKAHESGAVR